MMLGGRKHSAMAWSAAAGMWEASIASFETDIRRRPYHQNCGCALHRSCNIPADAPCNSFSSVSYPIRRRWGSLTSSSSSSNLAAVKPCFSIDVHATAGGTAAIAFKIDEED